MGNTYQCQDEAILCFIYFSLEHNCTSCPNAAAHSNLHPRFSVKPKLINPESNKCIQNIELNVIYQLLVPTLHKLKV